MVSRLVGGVLSQDRSPVGDHPSVQPTWPIGRAARGTLGLAPSGGCRAAGVATDAGALLPHRFTLTCAVIPSEEERSQPSAVFSLLPCTDRSPRPGSRQRSALWSPDLPRPPVHLSGNGRPRSPVRLTIASRLHGRSLPAPGRHCQPGRRLWCARPGVRRSSFISDSATWGAPSTRRSSAWRRKSRTGVQ